MENDFCAKDSLLHLHSAEAKFSFIIKELFSIYQA